MCVLQLWSLEAHSQQLPCCAMLTRRRQWHSTPVLLPGKSHGRRSLAGCRPWGLEESDTTERLHFHFSLSCIGEGNGNPLQCSCLENPRDGRAWWAAVYGVTQSRTQLKRISSSSSSSLIPWWLKKITSEDFSLFKRTEIFLWPKTWAILENVPHALQWNVYSAAIGQTVQYVCQIQLVYSVALLLYCRAIFL